MELGQLLKHPLRRRILRALHEQRIPSTLREALVNEGLSRVPSGTLRYHAQQLANGGVLTPIEQMPVYRSQVARDLIVRALLDATSEADRAE
jgi:DNA-binding transcriptional ArsR family regulator